MGEIVGKFRLDSEQALNNLRQLAAESVKIETAMNKAGKTAEDSFIKGSNGAKRLEAELKKQPKTLAEMELKLQRLKELLRDDTKIGTDGFKKIRTEIEKTEKEINGLNGKLKTTGNEMSGLGSMAKKVGGMLVAAFAVDRIIEFGKEVVMLAAKSEGVERAFKRIGSPQLLQGLRDATRGTVSDLVLMQNSVKASNFKIPLESLASLFKFAQARARETGESVDYLVDSIILGIGRKSPLILDNLGISAVELRTRLKGVGVEAANVGDIAKIIGDIATEELAKMGDQADTTADKIAKLGTSWENLKTFIGKSLIGEFSKLSVEAEGLSTQIENLIGSTADISTWEKVLSFGLRSLTTGFRIVGAIAERTLLIINGVKDGIIELGENAKIEAYRLSLSGDELIRFNEIGRAAQLIVIRRSKSAEDYADFTDDATRATAEFNKQVADTGGNGGTVDTYVRSINQLSKELKDLQEALEKAEIGGVDFYRIADEIEAKIKEIDRAMRLLVERKYANQPSEEIASFNITEIDAQETTTDNILKDYEYRNGEIEKAIKKRNKMEAEAAEERRKQEEANTFAITQQSLSSVSQIFSSIAQIQQNAFAQEQEELNRQLEQGLITREEFERKELEIRRKSAQAAKDTALFQAVISTAQATVAALGSIPFTPANIALAALVGATGAAQIAAIAATPIPKYAEGGFVDSKGLIKGRKHTQGGVHIEAEGGEFITNAIESGKHSELLTAINKGIADKYIAKRYVQPAIDKVLLNGWQDFGKMANLNGLTVNANNRDMVTGIDRLRQSQSRGVIYLGKKLDKLTNRNTRTGW
jgi:hypothetical protein